MNHHHHHHHHHFNNKNNYLIYNSCCVIIIFLLIGQNVNGTVTKCNVTVESILMMPGMYFLVGEYVVGETASFTCGENYVVFGKPSGYCSNDGVWIFSGKCQVRNKTLEQQGSNENDEEKPEMTQTEVISLTFGVLVLFLCIIPWIVVTILRYGA